MPQLSAIKSADAATALARALEIQAAGAVPLIIDPAAPISSEPLNTALPETAAWAALTSGTTGEPKIVVRSAESWRVAFPELDRQLGLELGDGLWMPVHQVSSMALFTAAWAHDSELELVIPTKEDPGIARTQVAHVTPIWLERLVDLIDGGQSSTIHTVLVGGDRLSDQLKKRANAAGLRVICYVGATELSLVAWDLGNGMCPFPGVSTTVIDGQLWVSSPQVALEVIGGSLPCKRIDEVDFTTVGDRVTEHEGVLEFLGRTDGAIITAGATVIPSDVETVINQHDEVRASLVLGQPDSVLGHRVVSWFEGTAEIAQLRKWVRSRLPKAARPVQWHRVDRLARTASGKVRRIAPTT